MNKFAQQLTDDIVEMAMYKIACLAKLADAEPPAPQQPAPQQPAPQQEPQTYPKNLREMDPRRAAEALNFESRIYHPMVASDLGDIPGRIEWTTSPVLGNAQGVPQRYAETAMEQASGMTLPRPPYSKQLGQAIGRYEHPLYSQYWDLEKDPYGQGFKDDIDKYLYSRRDEDAVNPEIPTLDWDARNPGRMLRRQQNFYPRQQPRQ